MAENKPRRGLPAETARELLDLLKAYLRQETVEPLRRLGRYVGLGLAGSALLAVGLVLLALSGLRALQTETGSTFTGSWSWAPYLIVLVGLGVAIALLVSAVTRGRTKT